MHPEAERLDDDSPALPRSYVQTHDLTRTFRRGSEDVHALVDVTLAIPPSAFAVVLGPSGSGKSTLLNLIGGIDRPTRGRVRVDGLELDALSERQLDGYRRDYVGFVFQFNNLLPNLNALENVACRSWPGVSAGPSRGTGPGCNWRPLAWATGQAIGRRNFRAASSSAWPWLAR